VVTDVGDSALMVGGAGEIVPPATPAALCEGFRLVLERLGPDLRDAARVSILGRFTNDLLVTETVKALCRCELRADSMIAAARRLLVGWTYDLLSAAALPKVSRKSL